MKITKAYRYEFRDALIEKGVPDVIAVMASEAVQNTDDLSLPADSLIIGGFDWYSTEVGIDFWHLVYEELRK